MLNAIKENLSTYLNKSFATFDISSVSLTRISFIDIIDILIVAYFIYKIILWIKETRAWSLFKGVVVILVMAAVAFSFGLTTVSWLIKTAINVGILAIIILFQPELRKALEQLGKGRLTIPFFGSLEKDYVQISENTVDEVIKSCFAMAKVRTGALLLIERDVKLGDLEQTGISIDSKVSSPLLINIFEDKTPLHDGAVIISNNRIAAASCILPLTQTEIGKELGTRHRAAVGASEVSDCIAIVVSEETGGVSVAVGGKIKTKQSPEDLRRQLLGDAARSEKKKFSFLRRHHDND